MRDGDTRYERKGKDQKKRQEGFLGRIKKGAYGAAGLRPDRVHTISKVLATSMKGSFKMLEQPETCDRRAIPEQFHHF